MEVANVNIDRSAITPLINPNETQIIVQRHCAYDRDSQVLKIESIQDQVAVVDSFIEKLKKYSKDELKRTFFLFAASNTLVGEDFKRCVATTNIAMQKIADYLKEYNLDSNILNFKNNYNNTIHEDSKLSEPKMFTDNTGYYEFLKAKNPDNMQGFWIDFEEDKYADEREKLNAEGPDQIVARSCTYIEALQRYASHFHKTYSNSRLIIWNGSHYDLISPLAKQKIFSLEKEDIVTVDYCGGLSIKIDDVENLYAIVNNCTYAVDLEEDLYQNRYY